MATNTAGKDQANIKLEVGCKFYSVRAICIIFSFAFTFLGDFFADIEFCSLASAKIDKLVNYFIINLKDKHCKKHVFKSVNLTILR